MYGGSLEMTWGLYGFVADLTFAWQAVPLPRLPVRKGLVTALPAQILPSVPVRKGFCDIKRGDSSSLRYELLAQFLTNCELRYELQILDIVLTNYEYCNRC
jgi:hypothetical protein